MDLSYAIVSLEANQPSGIIRIMSEINSHKFQKKTNRKKHTPAKLTWCFFWLQILQTHWWKKNIQRFTPITKLSTIVPAHHPQRTAIEVIFFRGVGQPPTRKIDYFINYRLIDHDYGYRLLVIIDYQLFIGHDNDYLSYRLWLFKEYYEQIRYRLWLNKSKMQRHRPIPMATPTDNSLEGPAYATMAWAWVNCEN
jgi:hypothetical protein